MITRLLIQNYALIDNLEMDFSGGLNVITGETGAGKSIIMDALSLALGQRADSASLRDADKKCIVEVEFNVGAYGLEGFFKANDLDAESTCLVRREINAQGRSRAFINDTPVNVSTLKELALLLVDVHSQHQTVEFTQPVNQLEVIDQVAGNREKKV
ncbi:MAG: AAA family ATPase, partial [Flavobacteriales bacterium]